MPRTHHRGQAAVELVALLPLVVLVLLVAWQVVLFGHAAWSAHAAARAAARAHAVGGDELRAARASLPKSLDRRIRVAQRDTGVRVRLRVPTVLPGLPSPTISASSTFADQS